MYQFLIIAYLFTLIKEGQARKSLYKKYKRAITSTDGIDTVLVSDCVLMSGLGIMMPIVLLPLEVAAGICGTVGICVKFARRKLHTKTQKHDQIRTIADSKLNSMKYLISKALQDGQILDAEFKAIQRFNTMQEAICVKRSEISEDEKKKKLIEQGMEKAMTALRKGVKMCDLLLV